MEPEAVREFVAEFTAEWNRLAAESNADRAHDQSRLTTIERKIGKIIERKAGGRITLSYHSAFRGDVGDH
ncbi:hypothetical protein [Acidocella sp. MX-AZ02]|uniref:hypothetical protein n=1 Tax=Acidocella sp. MX-AZ02 TaxID=1214225 RepID=UPI00028DA3AB|nr:hypothetical protein [Acidocella sp. MX-AZ02]EKM99853.1 hypothetical protein MXAZACID_08254 [Acidocella sp. MX-AZ02]